MILKLSLEIDIGLMKDYFKHVLHLPMNFLIHVKAEKYCNVLWISKIREALSSSTVTLLVDTFMIIVGCVLLYLQSPTLLLITVILYHFYFM